MNTSKILQTVIIVSGVISALSLLAIYLCVAIYSPHPVPAVFGSAFCIAFATNMLTLLWKREIGPFIKRQHLWLDWHFLGSYTVNIGGRE